MENLDFRVIATLTAPFITFFLGLFSVGILWLIRTVHSTKHDLNEAFHKIRQLEDEIYGQQSGMEK